MLKIKWLLNRLNPLPQYNLFEAVVVLIYKIIKNKNDQAYGRKTIRR